MYDTSSIATADYYISTSDIPFHLANVEYRLDMIITILLWSAGVIAASVVIYILYRFILRFL